ncbi:hypothetical protein D9613_003639 [Agrocybe pediades]|uniref:Uncharacterized protein n=1 Tax=Agrocybe pediades TaxID=84607 RepID=A0A8H4QKL1_9AGAR|nr:hypothetical protein D9613_003639 [Agrocybe pediades]
MPRVTNSDQAFKKNEVVIGKPATTDTNINDDYYRDPPNNNPRSEDNLHKERWTADQGDMAKKTNPDREDEVPGMVEQGVDDQQRLTKTQALEDTVVNNSLHA